MGNNWFWHFLGYAHHEATVLGTGAIVCTLPLFPSAFCFLFLHRDSLVDLLMRHLVHVVFPLPVLVDTFFVRGGGD